jgi:amidophosphoribosyltransferase
MTNQGIFAMRDPLGLRPLCLGEYHDDDGRVIGWIAASESSALLTVGARFLREVRPGEIVRIDDRGPSTVREPAPQPHQKPSLCIFEYVYFARPDSRINGQNVHVVRQRLGRRLASEAPVDADVVIGVPDSSLVSAMAFAQASGIPYTEGLIKNRYIGRTFIQPSQRMRKNQVRLKFNALRDNLEGKRVVLVDDSIVRGTTMGPLVSLVRDGGGAKEVHVRIAAPPVSHPCFMGIDLATYDQLIARQMTIEGITKHVGADSLAYLSMEGLHAAVREGMPPGGGHCDACFSGRYPVDVSAFLGGPDTKLAFERAAGDE